MELEPITMAESLARGIRRARAASGQSQGELADAAGVSRNLVSNLERGKSSGGAESDPQISTLVRLGAALGVSPAELLFPPDEPHVRVEVGDVADEAYVAWSRFSGFTAESMMPMMELLADDREREVNEKEDRLAGMIDASNAASERLERILGQLEVRSGVTTSDIERWRASDG